MRTSPPVRAGWRVFCVFLALTIATTPLALLITSGTAHAAQPRNPRYTMVDSATADSVNRAVNSSLTFVASSTTSAADTFAMPAALAMATDGRQIAASQTVTTTPTITATRGGGLSLPRLSLPRGNNEDTDETAEDASDESADSENATEEAAAEDTTGTSAELDDISEDTSEETVENAQADDDDTAASGAIDNLADVRKAVVQIEAVGTFVDPAEGLQLNAAGRGSGFIIDPSGIAVTNNHVVTGGGLYKVYLDGEDQPRNAKVLGVSECADLAVIDIQGDEFAYLEWYDGQIQVGLDVYAVGFPLGDPEYTMTRGIVAKERADGETNWASVDRVIQHDASINPGNSGGPLVNADGQVLAVNYAGNSETNQYFAIERDQAIEVIEQLRTGINVDSIGINGEAVNNGEGLSGHWVASVKSGSPADRAGIQGGDIILKMEGLVLGDDGTMSTYCDILRSHSADDVLAVQVLRFATEEVLEGQLNGRELTPSFSIAEELNGGNAGTTEETTDGSTAAAPTYSEYTAVTDRTGILSVEVPNAWDDVESTDWIQGDETVGIRLVAATSLEDLYASWGFPGLIFGFSRALVADYTPADLLDNLQYNNDCTYDGRSEVPEGFFTGAYDIWKECKGEENGAVIMSVVPEDNEYILLLEIYLAGDADFDALDRILDTFVVDRNNIPSTASTAGSTASGTASSAGENIFDLVDVTGLIYEYTLLNDQALTAIIPSDWGDVSSDLWVDEDDDQLGYRVSAASDIDAYNDTWTTSGIYVRSATGLESALDIDDLLDSVDLTNTCTYDDRYDHSHTIYGITYEGAYDLYTDCDGEANAFVYLAAQSTDLDQAVLLEFLAVDEADVEAFDVLLQSFYIGEVVEGSESAAATDEAVAYVTISDETETLLVRVPPDWTDIRSGDWEVDGSVVGIQLEASPDLDSYENSWTTPGLFFGASPDFSGSEPSEILDVIDFSSDCSASDRFEYDDGFFAGHYDLWEACGDTDTNIVFLAATSLENPNYLVLLGVQLPTADDFATLDEIFSSFNLDLPPDGISTDNDDPDSIVPVVTVRVDALNVRNGPGTGYNRIGSVRQGDELLVIGEVYNCGWLQVQTRNELVGWISGSLEYIDYNVDCSAIPLLEVPAAPTSSGNNNPRTSGNTGVGNQGCYLFQNGIGPELTITYTRRGDGWNVTFKVPPDGEYRQCFPPGEYTYTLDAPPPWGSTNGEMTVSAGDNYLFPITPSE